MSNTPQFSSIQEQNNYDKVRETLVSTILEKTLSDAGIYHQVILELDIKYDSALKDCFRHPKYFSTTLEDYHREMYDTIVTSINRHLEIYSDKNSITEFLHAINHQYKNWLQCNM